MKLRKIWIVMEGNKPLGYCPFGRQDAEKLCKGSKGKRKAISLKPLE